MRIGITGAGSMGEILARHLARRGHHVSFDPVGVILEIAKVSLS
jgi:ketopantoate reductase